MGASSLDMKGDVRQISCLFACVEECQCGLHLGLFPMRGGGGGLVKERYRG